MALGLRCVERSIRRTATSNRRLTPRWSQRALPLEFADDFGFIKIPCHPKPAHDARGSALDR